MRFGDALNILMTENTFAKGESFPHEMPYIQRSGWNGKGLKVFLYRVRKDVPMAYPDVNMDFLMIEYPNDAQNTPGARVPWLASQTDLLAEDWSFTDFLGQTLL